MTHKNGGEANRLQDQHRRSEQDPVHLGGVVIEDDQEEGGRHVDDGVCQTQERNHPDLNVDPFQSKTENAETNEEIVEITPEVQEMKVFHFLHGPNVIRFEEFNVGDSGNKENQKMPGVANNKRNWSVNVNVGTSRGDLNAYDDQDQTQSHETQHGKSYCRACPISLSK